jgi:hypothetical protein
MKIPANPRGSYSTGQPDAYEDHTLRRVCGQTPCYGIEAVDAAGSRDREAPSGFNPRPCH